MGMHKRARGQTGMKDYMASTLLLGELQVAPPVVTVVTVIYLKLADTSGLRK